MAAYSDAVRRAVRETAAAILVICMALVAGLAPTVAFAQETGGGGAATLIAANTSEGTEVDTTACPNGIPTLYLDIDADEYQDMIASWDHSVRATTEVSFDLAVPQGYTGEFSEDALTDLQDVAVEYIRGRGNSTWASDKKPYKMKLAAKTNLLGMGASKHWTLLANVYDDSLLRNRVALYMGRALGLKFTPKMAPVDLYVNEEYQGSYTLCPQVRIGSGSVEIDELDTADAEEPGVTGGYLLGLGPDQKGDKIAAINKFSTSRNVLFHLDEPDFSSASEASAEELKAGSEAQRAYITAYLQQVEDAIFAGNMQDENGTPYSDLLDIASAARYWWVQEFSANSDAFATPSTYLYKEREGKLCWGPLWDFDLAFCENSGLDTLLCTGEMPWLDHMRANDPAYLQELIDVWAELDSVLADLTEEGGVLDRYAEEIKTSWTANSEMWGDELTVPNITFDEAVSELRTFIEKRRAGIESALGDAPGEVLANVFATLTLESDGEVVQTCEVRRWNYLDSNQIPDDPLKEGYCFLGWQDDAGQLIDLQNFQICDDTTLHAAYALSTDVVMPTALYLNFCDVWAPLGSSFRLGLAVVPEDAYSRQLTWESSNPDVAEVSGRGRLSLKQVGETTITCTAFNGVSASVVVHVFDIEQTPLGSFEDIRLASETLRVKAGEYFQLKMTVSPQPSENYVFLDSSDESVAKLLDAVTGAFKAVAPGICTISATGGFGENAVRRTCTVTVYDDQTITAADKNLTAGKKVAIGAATSGNGKLSYTSSNPAVASVSAAGIISAKKAGTAKITITAAATSTYQKATKTITVKVVRAANTLVAKAKRSVVKVSRAKLARKAVALESNVKVTKAKGAVTFSNVSANKTAKKFKVAKKTGKVKVPKRTKRGTYVIKVKVKAKRTAAYRAASKTVRYRIRVK